MLTNLGNKNTIRIIKLKRGVYLVNNEFAADLITLVDEEGTEHEFEILDVIENEKGCFFALSPTFESPEEEIDFSGTYFIFEEIETDGEKQLAEVEDDQLLDELAKQFEDRFEQLYEFDEDDQLNQ